MKKPSFEKSKVEPGLLIKYKSIVEISSILSWIIGLLLVAEIFVFALFPSISDPKELLIDFSKNWFIGLLRFDLLGILSYFLLIPVTFSIYFIIRSSSTVLSVIGVALFFVGITIFFSTNTAFSVLSLSKQYVISTTDAERNSVIAACLSMITLFKVNAFMFSYIVVSASWIILSVAMLKSKTFNKSTPVSGILAGSSGIIAELFENTSVYLRWPAIILYFFAILYLIIWITGTGVALSRVCKNKVKDQNEET